ncbi:tRNA epoxyqueuosine(34) reductase QueG [Rhodopseudomonas palustris]|uniref:tRNA epoxyqueuosine(34) reductase QueG n=1 Tax=Rhodopseudomonas palustris TaxID=1076 RepID=UPI0021F288CC|nr:tRNA epoxyqueuosine(34) reductase QueG [Rhodopseudomonas palustris]UYO53878.1 tRNA epoxyqueuosine(34) reductase QueG [Rhodopseudomonas palustris]
MARRRAGLTDLRGSGFLTIADGQPASAAPGDAWKAEIADQARALGFDAFGICAPDSIPEAPARLRAFLDAGYHGDMAWLADRPERRSDPRVMWSEVRSVILLGFNYGPDTDPRAVLARKDRGAISVYAQGDDYHDVIKARLKQFARWLVATAGGDVKVFIDTAAVMEKPLAQAAGLGWQGRHTNLVSKGRGSWMFLGAVFTTLDLPRDAAEHDHCGSCRACLDACPTGAFPAPYQLDARRCISYLTIEHKGPIPREFRARLGNRIYGCDDCLAACPWNKFAQAGREAKLAARDGLRAPALSELVALDDPSFRALFTKSPVKRIGRDRFIRNVLIAIGNSGDRELAPEAERLLADPSPTIRGAAAWALGQLLPPEHFAALKAAHLAAEADDGVRAEWGGVAAE